MREIAERIKKLWCEKIQLSAKKKWNDFGVYAADCWRFYAGPDHAFLYASDDKIALSEWALPSGSPRVTVNKCFQMVNVYQPFMHHRNPTRMMTNRRPEMPPELKLLLVPPEMIQQVANQHVMQQMAQAQMNGMPVQPGMIPPPDPATIASLIFPPDQSAQYAEVRKILMESVLNYTPNEFDLQIESLYGLTESLVTGRGVYWCEMVDGPSGPMPGTSHVPVEQFFVDPDFNRPKDWTWAARERLMPKYKFAQLWGIPEDELQGGYDESHHRQATIQIEGRENQRKNDGQTHDLIRYWEIYSRCGLGQYLQGADEDLRDTISGVGDAVYLVVTDSYPEPVNFRSDLLKGLEGPARQEAMNNIGMGLQWPSPFWRDATHPWPFALCDFHFQNSSPWPVSPMRPALGCQKIIDWIWSHVAAKIKKSGQTKWLYRDDMDPETLDKMSSLIDHEWIPIRLRNNETMRDVVMQMEVQPMNRDLFEVAQYFEHIFELITGVSALLSTGESSRQMRSSYEAQLKEKLTQSRPEAMADTYENTQSRAARNEAIMLRRMQPQEIAPFFHEDYNPQPQMDATGQMVSPPQIGEMTQLWSLAVHEPDDAKNVSETDFRIEAGSMRKPNIGEALAGLNESMQALLQPLMLAYQQTGNPSEINKLLAEYSKRALPTMPAIQLPPLPMQPPPESGDDKQKDKQNAA